MAGIFSDEEVQQRFSKLCERLKMKEVNLYDVTGLAMLGLRLAFEQPEFKTRRRGRPSLDSPIDKALVRWAVEIATTQQEDERKCVREIARRAEREGIFTGKGDRNMNRNRLLRVYETMKTELPTVRAAAKAAKSKLVARMLIEGA